MNNLKKFMLAIAALGLVCLGAPRAHAQGSNFNTITISPSGRPLAGENVSVCYPAATTAAAVANNLASLTMASNPQTAGFVAGMSLLVAGFTSADTYFNGTQTILSVTPTTIVYALVHANASASTNGTALQTGNQTTSCAGLASLYTDGTLSVAAPNPFVTDGLGNLSFWAAPGTPWVQIYGSPITTYMKQVILPYGTGSGAGLATAQTFTQLQTFAGGINVTGGSVTLPAGSVAVSSLAGISINDTRVLVDAGTTDNQALQTITTQAGQFNTAGKIWEIKTIGDLSVTNGTNADPIRIGFTTSANFTTTTSIFSSLNITPATGAGASTNGVFYEDIICQTLTTGTSGTIYCTGAVTTAFPTVDSPSGASTALGDILMSVKLTVDLTSAVTFESFVRFISYADMSNNNVADQNISVLIPLN